MIVSMRKRCNVSTYLGLDTSTIINFHATGCADVIASALPYKLTVAKAIQQELDKGKLSGRRAWVTLERLIDDKLIEISDLSAAAYDTLDSLLFGEFEVSLELGEAATIALACDTGCIAGIDESKARKLCSNEFPNVTLISTVELLFHENIRNSLGMADQANVIFAALRDANMQVPQDKEGLVRKVVDTIGYERAQQCDCLLAWARR